MKEPLSYESFETREDASAAAADILGRALERRLDGGNEATLVLSGGTTPVQAMRYLAGRELPWDRVHVTLSDERWVPPTDRDSNERMLRDVFLSAGPVTNATFLPLFAADETIEDRCRRLAPLLLGSPFPFAATLLGMGEDGHFASLFPDAPNLDAGLDVDGDSLAIPVNTAASPHARVSLTLAALSRSDEIVLLVFGEPKLAVLNEAASTPDRYPAGRLLMQKRAPVNVLWAP